MKIRATFTGENESLGYKTGKEYQLQIQPPKNYSKSNTTMIFGRDEFGNEKVPCCCNNIITFLTNWDHIEVIVEKKIPERGFHSLGA